MSWLNFNDSLNNIKGQITNFASGVLTDEQENEAKTELNAANAKIEELEALCATLNAEISTLKSPNRESGTKAETDIDDVDDKSWSWDVSAPTKEDVVVSNLRQQIADLKNEKRDLINSLEQLDSDCQQTTDKLVTLKDALQSDYNELKDECERLRSENESLARDGDKNRRELEEQTSSLKIELKNLQTETETKLKDLSDKLKASEKNGQELAEKCKILEERLAKNSQSGVSAEDYQKLEKKLQEYENKSPDHDDGALAEKYENLQRKYDSIVQEKLDIHKKYIGIITENVKKYVEETNPPELQPLPQNEEDQQMSDFGKQVESIVRLLLDFKSKTETLEEELLQMSEEKTKILTEKNYEIEKLLKNSEILSQEVITKSQTIKDYELECSALIKNNDLLINELENYKNSSGLQTISESNEDNMLLLESQLESASKEIKELRLQIADLESGKQDANLETQTELDYIKKQLNLMGTELSQMKTTYQDLLVRYDKMEVDYNSLKKEHMDFETASEFEKHELQAKVDELRNEVENVEYQYLEEIESGKARLGNVLMANQKLEALNNSLEGKLALLEEEVGGYKAKLKEVEEERDKNEQYSRGLVEKLQNAKMSETSMKLQCDTIFKELQLVNRNKAVLENKYKQALVELEKIQGDLEGLKAENAQLLQEESSDRSKREEEESVAEKVAIEEKQKEIEALQMQADAFGKIKIELQEQIEQLKLEAVQFQDKINELTSARELLMQSLTAKHQESVTYHTEIQRLNQILAAEAEKAHTLQIQLNSAVSSEATSEELRAKNEEMEKLADQNGFLREKCEVLTKNLLEEQSNTQKILAERSSPSEREQALAKKLERLQEHLVEIEENYTQELLHAEQRNNEMQAKVAEIEQREKNSSTMYTSVSIRANQQVETLQLQLQLVTNQRDELRKRISDAEDENTKQAAALANLQFVLEQFQKDKERDVHYETERIRKQIGVEKRIQEEMRNEIANIKAQLEESKQGLQAAARLSDQLEYSKQQTVSLKQELTKSQEKLAKMEENYNKLMKQTDSKVDKQLVKNLVIGFAGSNPSLSKDQQQILKIIATVLDFSQQEQEKIKLNKSQDSSWWGSLLFPSGNRQMSQESLSAAFVRFLENESKPMVVPSLLDQNSGAASNSSGKSGDISRQSPSVLSEVVLPTFADFAQNRNSSSILKDVLKDNS